MRDQLSTSTSPLHCRYDKFSVDITEQVSVDLEGQHELTVEVFDPTGGSEAQRHGSMWGLACWDWALLCAGGAECVLLCPSRTASWAASNTGATVSCPHARCDAV